MMQQCDTLMIALIFQNHYERLQVSRQATVEEIKSAFRKQARIHHPDIAKDKEKGHRAFLLIKESYEVLLNPAARRDYDQLISASERFKRKQQRDARNQQEPPKRPASQKVASKPAQGTRPAPSAFDTRRPPRTDLDNFATLEISLEEALHGAEQTITVESNPAKFADHTFQTVNIRIPPMARRGQVLKIAGRGLVDPRTGEHGNLVLTIAYARHERFRLLGNDLFTSVDIYPWDGALGSFIRIPSLEGFASLKIPPGSQPWQSFRLKGNGMPGEDGDRGDLIVSLRFLQPPASTPEQMELWRKLKSIYR